MGSEESKMVMKTAAVLSSNDLHAGRRVATNRRVPKRLVSQEDMVEEALAGGQDAAWRAANCFIINKDQHSIGEIRR